MIISVSFPIRHLFIKLSCIILFSLRSIRYLVKKIILRCYSFLYAALLSFYSFSLKTYDKIITFVKQAFSNIHLMLNI